MRVIRQSDGLVAVEDGLRCGSLGSQDRPVGNLAVPFNQGGNRSTAPDHDLEELPQGVCDGTVVVIDEKGVSFVIGLCVVTGKMDLTDARERKVGQIIQRGEAMVSSGDEDIVDVEQQAASGAAGDGVDEVCLAHRRLAKRDIGRRVFEKHRATNLLLYLVDVIADLGERRRGIGQGQEVVEIGRLVRRPGKMLGDQRRFVAFDEVTETLQMGLVERLWSADRHAYPVQRHGGVAAHRFERSMRRSARAHTILGMNLEEAVLLTLGENCGEMFMFEPRSRQTADRVRRKTERNCRRCCRRLDQCIHLASPLSCNRGGFSDQMGFSEPCPPFGSWMLVQVPPWTNFHALPWKSVVEGPWQVVPGPAAQSFWPFSATPKHFSL